MSGARFDHETLLCRLRGCPDAGTLWRHLKTGNHYLVTGAAVLLAVREALVIYRAVGSHVVWARPLAEWAARFEVVGT